MTIQHTETIQRLWERFSRDQLAGIPPEERRQFEQQFEDRFAELVEKDADAPSGGRRLPRPYRLRRQGPRCLRGDGVSAHPAGLRRQRRAEASCMRRPNSTSSTNTNARRCSRWSTCCCVCSSTGVCACSAARARAACISSRSGSRCAIRCGNARPPIAARSTTERIPPPAGAVVNRNFHRQLVGFMVVGLPNISAIC